MTEAELSAALDRAFDDLLGLVSDTPGAALFDIAVQKDVALNKLQNHWWIKLGRFLHVL